MRDRVEVRRRAWLLPLVVAAAAVAAVVLEAGSLPHLHVGQGPGLFNQEHDLAYLATLAGKTVATAGVDVPAAPARADAPVVAVPLPPSRPLIAADTRAPPRA